MIWLCMAILAASLFGMWLRLRWAEEDIKRNNAWNLKDSKFYMEITAEHAERLARLEREALAEKVTH